MGTSPTPPGLLERILLEVDKRIAQFARSGFLRNARITQGGITIVGGFLRVRNSADTISQFLVGGLTPALPDGTLQPGILIRREDGTNALALYDPTPDPSSPGGFQQFLAIYDRSGNIIFSDDTNSGQGVARPYVGGAFVRARYADWNIATTSSTFETLWRGEVVKQHPQMSVATLSSMDTAGATGELRVMVDGVQLGSTATIGYAQTTTLFGPGVVAGAHMKVLTVEIQGRRTSAAGALKVEPLHLLGRQS